MSENKRVIGLIAEDISTDYARELIESVKKAVPKNSGLRLVVIAGRYTDNNDERSNERMYSEVYDTVYELGEQFGFDGLIIHPGSMNSSKMRLIERTMHGRLRSVPKVVVSSVLEGFTTVGYDNTTGVREAIEYIINVEGITKLCMLGGREDNHEATVRKQTFIESLRAQGIMFRSKMFEATDMGENSEAAAERLLDRNPETRAIFCVNDSVAVGLYKVMYRRGLVPGKDILVFGFDNTKMSSGMNPPLATVGAQSVTLGRRAVEMLLAKMNGEEVESELIRTKLYGRGSFDCVMYEFAIQDLIRVDRDFIYRMFDDCFYRWRNEAADRERVDLRRLYFEFISRMLKAMNDRYLSIEEFGEIGILIDIFFNEGAMEYTDAQKLLKSINRLQNAMANAQKMHSVTINTYINRLFLRMKDKALSVIAEKCEEERRHNVRVHERMHDFLIRTTSYDGGCGIRGLFSAFGSLGIRNAAVYMFDEKIKFVPGEATKFPDHIHLVCVMKNGELYMMPDERRNCPLNEMLRRRDLSSDCRGYAVFPVFFRDRIYGLFMEELGEDVCTNGELIAMQLGRMIYLDGIPRYAGAEQAASSDSM